MTPIEELAADARFAVEDLIEDDRWGWFIALSPPEQVQWRYNCADCDDFALTLHEITGWPVVAINNPSRGPVHRLVEAPDGRMLDAGGWVTLDDLRQRYKLKALKVMRGEGRVMHCPMVSDDEDFHRIVEALLQFPVAPFNESDFQEKAKEFGRRVGLQLQHRKPQGASLGM